MDIEIQEPHLPKDFKLMVIQLGIIIEIYHELIMVWARPALSVSINPTDEDTKQ